MKRINLCLGAAFAASFAMITAADALTLRFTDYGPNRGTRAEALQWFADRLKQRSGGELEVEFFWGGSLVGGRDTLKAVGDGVADMGTVIGFFTPRELVTYNLGDLPVENSDMWIGMRAVYELARENKALAAEFDKAGVTYVTNYTTGPIQLICRREVKSLDDFKGLKIRASGPYGNTFADLGADVSRLGQDEVYQALDSGLIDCNQNYYYAMRAYKQHEVAPYVLELDWGQNMSFGIVMNKAVHEGLNEKQRQVLDEVSSEFIDHLAEAMIAEDTTAKQDMVSGKEGKGITVIELPADEKARLVEMGGKYIDEWVARASDQGIDAAAVLADYRERIGKYQNEKDERGYPWTR